ncbi:Uncharacterised protein [Salmonella enterica subsp. enterica serovar Bovismorbificans]|uniref:Uncharacterized protein n=1 Tax=Salmonella enterica subsp. enterica serovar Bovismorbificans TaxID=58097 RepID=A0A655BR97_SALET|nr:Uncharacterised protein [Salmonella enterica subsp. enterica serovar Bovismorbificans]CNT71629.1 Uncharacterised protein [Salmonella enterica subsp. enterica serovar Bovismorbificans]
MEVGNHSGASWVPTRDNTSEKSVKTNATRPKLTRRNSGWGTVTKTCWDGLLITTLSESPVTSRNTGRVSLLCDYASINA